MNLKSASMIVALEIVMVAGLVLAGMAVMGFFEPKYSCNVAKSQETIIATGGALVMIFGSVIGIHRLNKAAKAKVSDDSAQNPPVAADLV